MFLTKRQQARIQSIKQDNARSREIIDITRRILDQEWPNAKWPNRTAPELRTKLEKMETDLATHRRLIDENESLIAKLESPIWKIWKLF